MKKILVLTAVLAFSVVALGCGGSSTVSTPKAASTTPPAAGTTPPAAGTTPPADPKKN